MKLFLTTLAVGFASAVLPFVNIEAYLGGLGAAIHHVGIIWVALAAAVGQTAGKVALYYGAEWVMGLSWIKKKTSGPKWTAAYDRWQLRIEEHPAQTGLLLFASASLGFPPLLVIAVLAGHLRVNITLFVSTVLIGRWIRFAVILGAANWVFHR